jgi:tetratricopeptide (TPR) repeat protein
LKYDEIAGAKSARLYANAEAATHFRRALEVAKRSDAGSDQISRLHIDLGSALELSGQYQKALVNYDEMVAFAVERGNLQMELSALMAKATVYSTFTDVHDPVLGERMLIQALEISREIGDRAAQAKLNWNLMLTYLFSKRLDQALPHGEVALALAREGNDREQLAFVLNDLCRLYTCRGEFEKSHVVIREARELWRSLGNKVMLADNLGSEGEAYFNAGEFDEALKVLYEALQVSNEIDNLWGQSYIRMLISFVHFESGLLGSGIQFAEEGVTLGTRAGLIASNSIRSELAWVYAYCGAFEKGFALIEEALQIAEATQPQWRAFPQAAKVRMHLLQGDVESAVQTAGDALLQPISIPYARYTIFLCLANIELAHARGKYDRALALAEDLLSEASPLVRVDIPEVLRWKGLALLGLDRLDEAHRTLTEAWSLARGLGALLQLLPLSIDLAAVEMNLGREKEAEGKLDEARKFAEQMAESLREAGLRDSFLNQPRIRNLMR